MGIPLNYYTARLPAILREKLLAYATTVIEPKMV
jgi:hypothetical protein